MAALSIVALFVLLGLGTVFVAMRGGPRGAREALHSQSRAGRRIVNILIGASFIIFGAAIPAVALLDNEHDVSKTGPGGNELTASQRDGRELFADKCATCHALGDANAVGRVGPDLDQLRPTAPLVVNAIQEGRARGMGQMPAELIDGQDARNVASYVARVAGR